MAPDATAKFPEAAFRTGIYALLWLLSFYSMTKREIFFKPYSIWIGEYHILDILSMYKYKYHLEVKAGLKLTWCSHIASHHNCKCHTNEWQNARIELFCILTF